MHMLSLIPQPLSVTYDTPSAVFVLNSKSRICFRGPAGADLADLLAGYLRRGTGLPIPVDNQAETAEIVLRTRGKAVMDEAGFADESYSLKISPCGIMINSENDYGLARAIQTLRQLFSPDILAVDPLLDSDMEWSVPCVRITDRPRFRWRGLHWDIARHFYHADQIIEFLDVMALHKFNILHLHLTDDQGWRIPIDKWPRLTEIGSIRAGTLIGHESRRPRRYDDRPYGGFLTKSDIAAIVTYAAARRITVVPEIDMPGHMQAAIAAYPQLGNLPITLEPRCHWGISQHILNPMPETISFMKDVLSEVMDLFPARFIHIGGDEARPHEWSESAAVQKLMKEIGVQNESRLQSWFIGEMGRYITDSGRRMIGWDEILIGGLPEGASVMSWRDQNGAVEAAKLGHDAVASFMEYAYLDCYQDEPIKEEPLAIGGMLTTGKAYTFNPVPAAVPVEKGHHILGGQGQLWTEYIPDFKHLQYMAFPRACALAECLWLDENQKSYKRFLTALAVHRQRLSAMKMESHLRP